MGYASISLLIVGVIACTSNKTPAPTIRVDGSSTVYPMSEAASEEFQTLKRAAVRVTVGSSGTGGGFKKFCRGETDVQGASRPISLSEIEACKKKGISFLELPVAYDAITIVVSRKNEWLKSITTDELRTIWGPDSKDKIIEWQQVRKEWPKKSFRNKLYGPGSEDGTFHYFTEAIMHKARSHRPDYTASEDDNTIVTGVSQDDTAMGYVPFAYYKANEDKLRAVPVVGGAGAPSRKAIEPSEETVHAGTYHPLSRPIFIYVNSHALNKPEIVEFATFYIKHAAQFAREVKYIPLSTAAYDLDLKIVAEQRLGTRFDGESKPGIKLEALLTRGPNGN